MPKYREQCFLVQAQIQIFKVGRFVRARGGYLHPRNCLGKCGNFLRKTWLKPAQTPEPNLPLDEITALGELSRRGDIVIKPADKGSTVVIMDKARYVQEGLRQLTDESFYSMLASPIFMESIPRIERVVDGLLKTGFI